MPRPPLDQLKPEYLDFIDLVRQYRRQELGKRGPIFIPKQLVDAVDHQARLSIYIEQLVADGILGEIRGTEPSVYSRVVLIENAPPVVEFNCLQSIEEIAAYKESLRGTISAQPPIIPASTWTAITIRFTTDQEVVVETPEAGQRITSYEGLGFIDGRSGRPNAAWVLLYGLALHGGEYAGEVPIPDRVKQQKMALTERLQRIFGLDSDPFEPYQERGTYRILLTLVPPTTDEGSAFDEAQEGE